MDVLRTAGQVTFFVAWAVTFVLLYLTIKLAVVNGIREGTQNLNESIKRTELLLIELIKRTKKENQ